MKILILCLIALLAGWHLYIGYRDYKSADGEKQTGIGTFTYAKGGKYDGDLVDGVPDGEGTRVWPNGSTYTGGWKDGKMSGQGEYVFPSGARYVGAWLNGKYHGEGKYTDVDGITTHAIYENGKAVKTLDGAEEGNKPAQTEE